MICVVVNSSPVFFVRQFSGSGKPTGHQTRGLMPNAW